MSRRQDGAEVSTPGCGRPCLGAGALPFGDAEATFRAYETQVARWVDQTIVTMGFPHLDHLGRLVRTNRDASAPNEGTWRVRRQLRDPNSKFIPEVVADVRCKFFDAVRAGRACLYHLRGLMHTITERATWKEGTDRAKMLMRERLAGVDERVDAVSDGESPEDSLLRAEERRRRSRMVESLDREIGSFPAATATIVRGRHEEPPKPYSVLAAKLGMGEGAVRKRYHDAMKRLRATVAPEAERE
jgi:hypothetical protein